ncbi:GAD-like domain-containing protein [Fulvimarina sp. MAC8]|uniref:GAD-like domain-containing protein n=1 Tax=Fulvimarina sp. MAC8 TaxID=3162874 RepID=UPI0032EB3E02
MNPWDDFQDFIDTEGTPAFSSKPDADEIGILVKKLPQVLVDFLTQVGFGAYNRGLFRLRQPEVFRTILAIVFKADNEFHHDDCNVLADTAFGLLRIWSNRLGLVELSLPTGMVFCQALEPTRFRGLPD